MIGRELLPAGGARNAIDCALWDLEAKLAGKSIWELTGITPRETQSVLTVGIDSPDAMAARAAKLESDKIKVKLSEDLPLERITAVRKARPGAEIIVDVNQGWTFQELVSLAPRFRDLGIAMIEQPLPRGGDEELEGFHSPVTLCADESCLHTGEFAQAARRYQMINIKLDKTGGLTEALALRDAARAGPLRGHAGRRAPGAHVAIRMRAMVLDAPGRPLRPTDLPDPAPGPGQLLLHVLACGVCRTDLHVVEGDLPQRRSPLVPGHQIVGVAEGQSPPQHTQVVDLRADDGTGERKLDEPAFYRVSGDAPPYAEPLSPKRVARTIADLAGEDHLRRPHIAEALSYRQPASFSLA